MAEETSARSEWSSSLQEEVHQLWETRQFQLDEDPSTLLATLAVLVVTLLLMYIAIRAALRGKKRDTILLLGLSGAGKTALFYQLRDGSIHKGTVTSMEPNEGRFTMTEVVKKGKKVRLYNIVDVPGHPRLKPRIDEYLPQASGIVFVVDALDFMPQVRSTAEYLYDVLTKVQVVKNKIPLLLACNKMDKVTAHSTDFIRKQLEKEIDKLRGTRRALSDADVGSEITLGTENGPFQFTQCVNKVSVCETSVLGSNITNVEQFIRENVKP